MKSLRFTVDDKTYFELEELARIENVKLHQIMGRCIHLLLDYKKQIDRGSYYLGLGSRPDFLPIEDQYEDWLPNSVAEAKLRNMGKMVGEIKWDR